MYDYRTMFDLSGKYALVVGGGRGIGQAAAMALAAHGAFIHCADIDLSACQETVRRITASRGKGEAIALDMRDATAIDATLAALGRLHVMVTTPSINVRKPLLEISEEEFERVINLNLKGTFLLLKAVGRRMADAAGGSIIVFSSIRSQLVEPGQGVYAATKAGTVQMMRALAAELAPKGVRVNAIAPGVVETPLTAQIKEHPAWYQAYAERNAMKRWAQPHEMAGAVLLLASDAGSYMTGSLIFVDGGWTAIDGRFSPPL
jgi:NAD(P)-dependent dehydrogenase (short-subunit alcohol dehydrogenase family)